MLNNKILMTSDVTSKMTWPMATSVVKWAQKVSRQGAKKKAHYHSTGRENFGAEISLLRVQGGEIELIAAWNCRSSGSKGCFQLRT